MHATEYSVVFTIVCIVRDGCHPWLAVRHDMYCLCPAALGIYLGVGGILHTACVSTVGRVVRMRGRKE